MIQMMIDLETMSTRENAAVVAIAACMWEGENVIRDTFVRYIDPAQAMIFGHESEDTMEWWKGQDKEVFKRVFGGTDSPALALDDFNTWYKSWPVSKVWAGPAAFDFPILRNLSRELHIELPFEWWRQNCYRTIRELAWNKGVIWPEVVNEAKHDPLEDCLYQTKVLMKCLKALEFNRPNS